MGGRGGRRASRPGQQVVKIVDEELTELLGAASTKLTSPQKPPTVILLCGLQGSGKTTAAGKLARLLARQGKKPALVACDVQRPAAIEQLRTLGRQVDVPVFDRGTGGRSGRRSPRWGVEAAPQQGRDVVIVDTAGPPARRPRPDGRARARPQRKVKPQNVLLVLDAMTGQDAVNVAEQFLDAVDFDGVILTKLDGDARGGAALSVRAVTGKPIVFVVRRREARRARGVPSRPHGVAHPRHGRRALADRARRGADRRGRGARARAEDAQERTSRSTTCSTSSARSARWGRCARSSGCSPAIGKQVRTCRSTSGSSTASRR